MSYNWIRVLFMLLVLCITRGVNGQDENVYIKERPEGHRLLQPVKSNDCINFYNDRDSTLPKFRSVTLTRYAAKDSSLVGKRFEYKEKTTFNKMGEQLFYLKTDSLGINDSMRFFYDDRYNKIREVNYNRNDSGRMVNNTDNRWEFDAQGRLIRNHSRTNIGLYSTNDDIEEITYFSWGSELNDRSISLRDTTVEITRYDTAGREIYDQKNNTGFVIKEYWRYDAKGNVVFDNRVWKYDSTQITYTYDDKERLLENRETHKGIPINVITWHYNSDSSSSQVEEKTPESTGMSCPDDSRTVTMYDRAGRVVSELTTKLQDGKPFTRSTIHKFTFDNKGEILSDTAVLNVQGYLYSSWSVGFTEWKYDALGHCIEMVRGGGGDNDEQEKTTSVYNEQGKPLDEAAYNTCDATKPTNGIKHEYYPGGIKVKKIRTYNFAYDFYSTTSYAEDSRITEDQSTGARNYQILYEYEK